MKEFKIQGGNRLSGEILPQGAKNEALQVLCAVLLTPEEVHMKNVPDILDVNRLIDHLYLSMEPLCCPEAADCNGSYGRPDIADITRLIDHLFLSHRPLAPCK